MLIAWTIVTILTFTWYIFTSVKKGFYGLHIVEDDVRLNIRISNIALGIITVFSFLPLMITRVSGDNPIPYIIIVALFLVMFGMSLLNTERMYTFKAVTVCGEVTSKVFGYTEDNALINMYNLLRLTYFENEIFEINRIK